jgi:hypothetical protein
MTHKEVRKVVTLYYIEQGYKSLNKACEDAGVNYRVIDNMLNGRTEIKLPIINELVENLNEKFTIKVIEDKPLIVRR